MKRVLYISPNVDKYGAEKSLIALMKDQIDKGNKVLLIIPRNGPIEDLLRFNNIDYIIYKFFNWVNNGSGRRLAYGIAKYFINQSISYKLFKILKNMSFIPDIVHTNVITTDIGYHLAHRFKCHHIWHIREFGKLDFNMDFDLGISLSKRIISSSDTIIANSNAVNNYYKKLMNLNIVTVYNGISITPEIHHSYDGPIYKFIMVGRLGVEKNHKEALYAMKILIEEGIKNFHLDIFGNGTYESEIVKEINKLNLQEYVSLKGFSSNIDYSSYIVGLMCSNYEAFGRVTVEYMMNGLVVVGSDSGGTSEILSQDTGLLYKPGDPKDLAKQLKFILNNINICNSISKKARKIACSRFSTEEYFKNINIIYNQN